MSQASPRVQHDPPSAAPRKTHSAPSARVHVVHDPSSLEPYVESWEQLARAAVEPNVFYEPWFLLDAMRCFADPQHTYVAIVLRRDDRIIGLFPMTQAHKYHGLPVATASLWSHPFGFLATPLVDASHRRECMDAFFDWLRDTSGATLMEFAGIGGDGAFAHTLLDTLDDRSQPFLQMLRRTRGLYVRQESADAYLAAALDGEARRRLRRKEEHLAETGRVEYAALASDADVDAWIDDFLTLEASGWKGADGTALAVEPIRRSFFERMTRAAWRRGQLQMLSLRLDGRPIAMKCNLLARDGAYVFKIAYDERFARFSPGMLLEVDNIRLLHAQHGIRWMDSCANPRSRLFGDACIARRSVETLLVATGSEVGRAVLAAIPVAQWVSRLVRAARHRS